MAMSPGTQRWRPRTGPKHHLDTHPELRSCSGRRPAEPSPKNHRQRVLHAQSIDRHDLRIGRFAAVPQADPATGLLIGRVSECMGTDSRAGCWLDITEAKPIGAVMASGNQRTFYDAQGCEFTVDS